MCNHIDTERHEQFGHLAANATVSDDTHRLACEQLTELTFPFTDANCAVDARDVAKHAEDVTDRQFCNGLGRWLGCVEHLDTSRFGSSEIHGVETDADTRNCLEARRCVEHSCIQGFESRDQPDHVVSQVFDRLVFGQLSPDGIGPNAHPCTS